MLCLWDRYECYRLSVLAVLIKRFNIALFLPPLQRRVTSKGFRPRGYPLLTWKLFFFLWFGQSVIRDCFILFSMAWWIRIYHLVPLCLAMDIGTIAAILSDRSLAGGTDTLLLIFLLHRSCAHRLHNYLSCYQKSSEIHITPVKNRKYPRSPCAFWIDPDHVLSTRSSNSEWSGLWFQSHGTRTVADRNGFLGHNQTEGQP